MEHWTERLLRRTSDGGRQAECASSHPMTSQSPCAIDATEANRMMYGSQTASKTMQDNAMHAGSNRSLGERVHDALLEAASKKNDALLLKRRYERTLTAYTIDAQGKSFGERQAKAATHTVVADAEEAWIVAEQAANAARAQADGLQCRFEEWRTNQATNRAEMNLR